MKKVVYTFYLFIFFTISGYSQSCNCEKDFDFVINKIEKKHPGFKRNVTKNNRVAYQKLKNTIRYAVRDSVKTDVDCAKYISRYLRFIKDKHLNIYSPKNVDEKAYEKKLMTKLLPSYREIEGISYIKVPSFNYRLWKKLDKFYDSITPLVKVNNKVILDIRNNGGGGERMYNQLLKLIKRKNVVGIFNYKCASACEEVALKLNSYRKTTTIGQNTNGQFAYGYIKGYKTPNCKLTFITTTKMYRQRLKYEYIGVSPNILLNKNQDWIEFAVNYLNKKD